MDWNALIRVYIQVPQKSLNTFEELKEVIKEKISKYGFGNSEYLSGFNFFYLDDDSFIDDVASDWDSSTMFHYDNIWEFVVIKSILEVLNNKQYENK